MACLLKALEFPWDVGSQVDSSAGRYEPGRTRELERVIDIWMGFWRQEINEILEMGHSSDDKSWCRQKWVLEGVAYVGHKGTKGKWPDITLPHQEYNQLVVIS